MDALTVWCTRWLGAPPAAELFEEVALAPDLVEFLTLRAYPRLDQLARPDRSEAAA